MQEPIKKMNIHLTMGQQDGLQFLADVNVTLTSNPTIMQNIANESQFKQQCGNDVILMIHLYVEQGKQKQAVTYFDQCLKGTIDQSKKSPIQKFLKTSESKWVVDLIQTQGCIIIKYRFYSSEIDYINEYQSEFDKLDKATANFNLSLKGSIKHNNNNRTNVKVDFVDARLFSNEISPSDFVKIINALKIQQEEKQFVLQIPVLQMLGNLKSAELQIKTASFRQLKSFFNKASEEKYKKQDKPFSYENKGIFRKQISAFVLIKNKIGIKLDSIYNGEDVLMRLVKVYQNFLFNGLGL